MATTIEQAAEKLGKTVDEVAAICRGYVKSGREPPPVPTAFDYVEDFDLFDDGFITFLMQRERLFGDGRIIRQRAVSVAKFDNVVSAKAALDRANREGSYPCQSAN